MNPSDSDTNNFAERLEQIGAMIRIRLFEDEVHRLFARGLVRGTTHLCQGQEGVAVGACRALRAGDTMCCTYRGHGSVLAMGAPLDRSFGEILGKADGLCGGRGGSMHLTDVSVGAIGSFAIVGAHLPIAVGAALAARYRGDEKVSLCFFGDGSTNIGAFHEALNLASIWRLPVVFVCENNLYGEYSSLASTTPIADLSSRADSYGMPGVRVDGNDVEAVLDVVGEAVGRGRALDGPTLVEALTYRQKGHSRSDPASYRPEGELETWLERDPIARAEAAFLDLGGHREALAEVRDQAEREVAEALQRAEAWPEPDPEDLADGVWAA
jgi:pyruvate dehydrogenase E1 component alpha subunit